MNSSLFLFSLLGPFLSLRVFASELFNRFDSATTATQDLAARDGLTPEFRMLVIAHALIRRNSSAIPADVATVVVHGAFERRPIQNYLHAVFGIVVIGLGMYQIHTGFDEEWPARGFGTLSAGVNVLWVVWCILLVLLYAAGMWLLRKQYAQEAAGRLRSDRARIDQIRMSARGRDDLSP
ncbi:hypothetical protein DFH06DRAFT_1128525 [Mycena polygramma]|nr:hypothetical protein DFH06DRAFT_1128525 [Mycena polygramma]